MIEQDYESHKEDLAKIGINTLEELKAYPDKDEIVKKICE